jgi:hypothetical protein
MDEEAIHKVRATYVAAGITRHDHVGRLVHTAYSSGATTPAQWSSSAIRGVPPSRRTCLASYSLSAW